MISTEEIVGYFLSAVFLLHCLLHVERRRVSRASILWGVTEQTERLGIVSMTWNQDSIFAWRASVPSFPSAQHPHRMPGVILVEVGDLGTVKHF